MQDDFIKTYSDQFAKQYESIMQLNSILLSNLEKGIDFQFDALNRYTQISLEHANNIAHFEGLDDLQKFSDESSRIHESFNNQILKDSKKAADLSQDFITNADAIWQIL